MHHSSRLKLTTAFSLIFILVIGLSLIGFTKVITYAVGPTPKTSLKSLKVASVSPISNCGGWNAIVSPSPGQDNNLYGVAAISGNNAWAVGAVHNSGTSQTLVEHWNGTSWTVIASPSPGGYSDVLDSVVAISAKNVWAVGYSFVSNSSLPQTLIEHWNGMSWSVVPSPNAGGYNILSSVARVPGTSLLWAVGNYYSSANNTVQQTLIEQWNGTTWSVVPSSNIGPYGNILNGVTAISANNVWAVGAFYTSSSGSPQTLIERWNGTSWSIIPSPNPGTVYTVLNSVTRVPGTNHLWAVGSFQSSGVPQTLIEQWNGRTWSLVSTPSPGASVNTLDGVAGISANNAWAVGYDNNGGSYQTLIEQWNGTTWSIVPSPNPGSNNSLWGMAWVPGTSQLWAVGNANTSSSQTLTEFYC